MVFYGVVRTPYDWKGLKLVATQSSLDCFCDPVFFMIKFCDPSFFMMAPYSDENDIPLTISKKSSILYILLQAFDFLSNMTIHEEHYNPFFFFYIHSKKFTLWLCSTLLYVAFWIISFDFPLILWISTSLLCYAICGSTHHNFTHFKWSNGWEINIYVKISQSCTVCTYATTKKYLQLELILSM